MSDPYLKEAAKGDADSDQAVDCVQQVRAGEHAVLHAAGQEVVVAGQHLVHVGHLEQDHVRALRRWYSEFTHKTFPTY